MTTTLASTVTIDTTPVRVLSACLDGTLWIQFPHGGTLNVHPWRLTGLGTLPVPENVYRLNDGQVEVLRAFGVARDEWLRNQRPDDGLADFEHPAGSVQSTVAEHRRWLISRGLVAKRYGLERTNATQTGHVWAITHAGRQVLKPPPPTNVAAGAA